MSDVCHCGHGIERHNPSGYGQEFCAGRPSANHPFGDRAIGPHGPCRCTAFGAQVYALSLRGLAPRKAPK